MLKNIDLSSHLNLLSESMKTDLLASDLETAKVCIKTLLDDDLSSIKQFIVDDALASIDTLLCVPNLSSTNIHALHSLRYKINDLRKMYQAYATY